MRRVMQVAWREYASTVLTKGFIIGAFVVPIIIAAMIPLIVLLMNSAVAPQVVGQIALIDRSRLVSNEFESRVDLERAKMSQRQIEAEEEAKGSGSVMSELRRRQLQRIADSTPVLTIQRLDPQAVLEDETARLRESKEDPADAFIALLEIESDAVRKAENKEQFGGYTLYVRPGLDDRTIDFIRGAITGAIKTARYAEYGHVASQIEALVSVRAGETKEVTATGERQSTEVLRVMLPFAFMLLMMMAVMIGGQYLLTTTVEEKSSRVVEILLSAVSPMQLMTGKIIGQMGVGLTLLIVYGGVSMGALLTVGTADILGFQNVLLLFAYFLLAYFMIASLLAAVGSAVNDLREAQSLQTPVMLFVMLPYLFWLPISRDPNGPLALALSFIPPINPFVMIMRVTSTAPPPLWQIGLSLLTATIGAWVCVWFSAKVFRIGLLMYGKPPNLATLIRWARMA